MTSSAWQLRSIRRTQKDRKTLSSFVCANVPAAWQTEVEEFIQNALFDWCFSPLAEANDPRVLLLFDTATEDLVGVAAHESVVMQTTRRASFVATKLEVVAISRDWQGRAFGGGERASDVLMSGALADISARVPRDSRGSSRRSTKTTIEASPCASDTASRMSSVGSMSSRAIGGCSPRARR